MQKHVTVSWSRPSVRTRFRHILFKETKKNVRTQTFPRRSHSLHLIFVAKKGKEERNEAERGKNRRVENAGKEIRTRERETLFSRIFPGRAELRFCRSETNGKIFCFCTRKGSGGKKDSPESQTSKQREMYC